MDQQELTELLEKSREQAKATIDRKDGRGMLIFRHPDGTIDTILFGGDSEMAKTEEEQAKTSMDLILSLVLTYLPGSSAEHRDMHGELMNALRSVNTNVVTLFQFLQQAFPRVSIRGLKQDKPNDSGIII